MPAEDYIIMSGKDRFSYGSYASVKDGPAVRIASCLLCQIPGSGWQLHRYTGINHENWLGLQTQTLLTSSTRITKQFNYSNAIAQSLLILILYGSCTLLVFISR